MIYFTHPPTVEEIARALSTVPRWNARTILDRVGLRFSVLQHTLVGLALLRNAPPEEQVYWAFHDAEETLIGDIPKPYKTPDMAVQGDAIRAEILKAVGLPWPRPGIVDVVKRTDERVRDAEALTLLPPHERVGRVDNPALAQVWGVLDIPPQTAIALFTDTVHDLLAAPQVQTLRRLA